MIRVRCLVCGKDLPIDFFECGDCGAKNPQLQLVKREVLRISFEPEVLRTAKRLAIKRGVSMDRFVNDAIEHYATEIFKKSKKPVR